MFDIGKIENAHRLQTPVYFYDLPLLEQTLKKLLTAIKGSGFHVHYALKANVDPEVLKRIRAAGLGADCVSRNEIAAALAAGFPADNIVFAGVGKRDDEMRYALEQDIFCINCESAQEVEVLGKIAAGLGRKARIALRLNPDVDARTHQYITTGLKENKFGINLDELPAVFDLLSKENSVELLGIHLHIGSQITDMNVFRDLAIKVNIIQQLFAERDVGLKVINLGGGLGIDYHAPDQHAIPDFDGYFDHFRRDLQLRPGQEAHFELGRSLVAQCGTILTRVLYIKQRTQKNFAIVDAGMTDLIRPALYSGYHQIENLSSQLPEKIYEVVGPVCESADFLGREVSLPETSRGDLLAIRSTGAYGQVMASRYNLRDLAGTIYG